MAEITSAGYVNLRNAIDGTAKKWKFIEIQRSNGTKIVRREIGVAGSGATFEAREGTGNKTIVIKLILNGNDSDMPTLPVTVAKSILKDTDDDSASALSSEQLSSSFEFKDGLDTLTIFHKVHVPGD